MLGSGANVTGTATNAIALGQGAVIANSNTLRIGNDSLVTVELAPDTSFTTAPGTNGDISLAPDGTGVINFVDGSVGTVGDVWTSTGVLGQGNWETPTFNTRWQKRPLTASITNGSGVVSNSVPDLEFDSLEIGKTYRLTTNAHITVAGTSVTERAELVGSHDGNTLTYNHARDDQQGERNDVSASQSVLFVATAMTIEFDFSSNASGTAILEFSTDATSSTLEILEAHTITSEWTP